jgi:HK97 family phage prohead protease
MGYAKRAMRMKVRATPDAGEGTFEAKVSTYNLEYDIGWGWTEKILPGCFADSISEHPNQPTFYEHVWALGPVGVHKPEERDEDLIVRGHLYLGMDSRIDVVYQSMLDEALQEWSIAFWPETIITDKENPYCDQIAKGDLAEASICVRGANPDTETLDLRGQPAWIVGDDRDREREVARLRSIFNVPDLGPGRRRGQPPESRSDGHSHKHSHSDGTEHIHDHSHSGGNYDHDGSDPEVTHAHDHEGDDGGQADEQASDRAWKLWESRAGREALRAERSSRRAPSPS